LENNYKIIVNFTEEETFGIDTKEDLERANKLVSSQKQEN
jgi:CMP-2-keto-3-deoxyoctulosonic acid synthetase